MALECTPQELTTGAGCLTVLTPGQQLQIQTYLLCAIASALTPGMTCDPQTLLTSSECFSTLTPGQLSFINTFLLCTIANNGGGGGGGGLAFYTGTGSPEGVQSGSPGDTYWDLSTGFEWRKVTGTATTTGWLVH